SGKSLNFKNNVEELQTILTEVFGESSDSEGEEQKQFLHAHCAENRVTVKAQSGSVFGESHSWESITEINGLWLCKEFLSSDQQSMLLSSIHQEGWFAESSSNQVLLDPQTFRPFLYNTLIPFQLVASYFCTYQLENCRFMCDSKTFSCVIWLKDILSDFNFRIYALELCSKSL
ncbi:uncharacterized protein LOC132611709, partial [Lycium barbarum]|uniref:uncharacterized protein LOC132611709 n=1 Tax=Lycium barbarum TaxID=112863 RepID=UPI00293F3965